MNNTDDLSDISMTSTEFIPTEPDLSSIISRTVDAPRKSDAPAVQGLFTPVCRRVTTPNFTPKVVITPRLLPAKPQECTLMNPSQDNGVAAIFLNVPDVNLKTESNSPAEKDEPAIRGSLVDGSERRAPKRPLDDEEHNQVEHKKPRDSSCVMAGENGNEVGLAQLIKSLDQRINDRLDNISSEIKTVRETQANDFKNLKEMYSGLDKKISENEEKAENRMNQIEGRVMALELGSSNPVQLEANVKQNVDSLTEAAVAAHLKKLEEMENSWAKSMNASLANLDAKERELKRLNVVIKGLSEAQSQSAEAVKQFIYEKFGISTGITNVSISNPQGPTVTFTDWKTKQLILSKKWEVLKNTSIYVDIDMTPREEKIMGVLRAKAKAVKAKGGKVKVRFLKINIDGAWSAWDEVRQKLVPTTIISRKPIDKPLFSAMV